MVIDNGILENAKSLVKACYISGYSIILSVSDKQACVSDIPEDREAYLSPPTLVLLPEVISIALLNLFFGLQKV